MIKDLRERYNRNFTAEKYENFLQAIGNEYGYMPSFRLSETPVFIPADLKNKLIEACNYIQEVIAAPDFKHLTKDAIRQASLQVPGEDEHTTFLQMDFGITLNEEGEFHPQLIELQGFPSLYFFQDQLAEAYKKHFELPEDLTSYPHAGTREDYIETLRKVIVGKHEPHEVILLEIEPFRQNTAIDFYSTAHHLGINVLCITDLKKDGRKLFYLKENGERVEVKESTIV